MNVAGGGGGLDNPDVKIHLWTFSVFLGHVQTFDIILRDEGEIFSFKPTVNTIFMVELTL